MELFDLNVVLLFCLFSVLLSVQSLRPYKLFLLNSLNVFLGIYFFGPEFVLIFLIKILLDFYFINAIRSRGWLWIFILYEISVLLIYKYWAQENILTLKGLGLSYHLLLVLGIGVEQSRNFAKLQMSEFLSVLTLSTTYLSGPIERYRTLVEQLRKEHSVDVASIFILLSSGLLKMGIKGFLGSPRLYNPMLNSVFIANLYFYLDLSSYSDFACGLSQLLGIKLQRNFALPFIAKSFSAMWRGWHVSLNSWFQDYIYEPILFSRWLKGKSKEAKYFFSTLTTFIAIGLWHRLSVTYVFWAVSCGSIVCIEALIIQPFFAKRGGLGWRTWGRYLSYLAIPLVFLLGGALRDILLNNPKNTQALVRFFTETGSMPLWDFSHYETIHQIAIALFLVLVLTLNDSMTSKWELHLPPSFKWGVYGVICIFVYLLCNSTFVQFSYGGL